MNIITIADDKYSRFRSIKDYGRAKEIKEGYMEIYGDMEDIYILKGIGEYHLAYKIPDVEMESIDEDNNDGDVEISQGET